MMVRALLVCALLVGWCYGLAAESVTLSRLSCPAQCSNCVAPGTKSKIGCLVRLMGKCRCARATLRSQMGKIRACMKKCAPACAKKHNGNPSGIVACQKKCCRNVWASSMLRASSLSQLSCPAQCSNCVASGTKGKIGCLVRLMGKCRCARATLHNQMGKIRACMRTCAPACAKKHNGNPSGIVACQKKCCRDIWLLQSSNLNRITNLRPAPLPAGVTVPKGAKIAAPPPLSEVLNKNKKKSKITNVRPAPPPPGVVVPTGAKVAKAPSLKEILRRFAEKHRDLVEDVLDLVHGADDD